MNFKNKNNELNHPQQVNNPSVKNGKTSAPLSEEIKSLVKIEAAKAFTEIKKELSEDATKIAQAIATGLTDFEVIRDFKISQQELDRYYSDAKFVAEINRHAYNNGFATDVNRVRGFNRVLSDMFTALTNDPNLMSKIPAEKLVDLFLKYTQQFDKLIKGDKPAVQLDVVQIINNYVKDENRLKQDKKGQLIIESEYQTLDDIIDLECNDKGIYE